MPSKMPSNSRITEKERRARVAGVTDIVSDVSSCIWIAIMPAAWKEKVNKNPQYIQDGTTNGDNFELAIIFS